MNKCELIWNLWHKGTEWFASCYCGRMTLFSLHPSEISRAFGNMDAKDTIILFVSGEYLHAGVV